MIEKEKIAEAVLKAVNCKHKNLDYTDEKLSFFKRRLHIKRAKFVPVHCLDCGLLIPINKKAFKN